MKFSKDKKIVLIGFAATYKTSVGKIISKQLEIPFCDVDDLAEISAGKSVAEIFRSGGEKAFRAIETETLNALADFSGVVACGGGSVLSPSFPAFARNGVVVWLRAEAPTVQSRLTCGTRPLFDNLSLPQLHEKIVAREKLYAAFADFSVCTDGKTSEQVARECLTYFL